jgi:hypothetical protein
VSRLKMIFNLFNCVLVYDPEFFFGCLPKHLSECTEMKRFSFVGFPLTCVFLFQGEDLRGLDVKVLDELQNFHVEVLSRICQEKVRPPIITLKHAHGTPHAAMRVNIFFDSSLSLFCRWQIKCYDKLISVLKLKKRFAILLIFPDAHSQFSRRCCYSRNQP